MGLLHIILIRLGILRPIALSRPTFAQTPFGEAAKRLYEEAELQVAVSAGRHRRWSRIHYSLGLTTVVLATIAGFSGLGDLLAQDVISVLSLSAAIAAASATFLKTDDQVKHYGIMTAEWENLRQSIETVYATAPSAQERLDYAKARMATTPPSDPNGWADMVHSLQQQAAALRSGEVPTERTASNWP